MYLFRQVFTCLVISRPNFIILCILWTENWYTGPFLDLLPQNHHFLLKRQGILAQGKDYFLQGYPFPSPALLKDLPGRSNCKLILNTSKPEGKASQFQLCAESNQSKVCSSFVLLSVFSNTIVCFVCQWWEPETQQSRCHRRPRRVYLPQLLLLFCKRAWRGFLIKGKSQ